MTKQWFDLILYIKWNMIREDSFVEVVNSLQQAHGEFDQQSRLYGLVVYTRSNPNCSFTLALRFTC